MMLNEDSSSAGIGQGTIIANKFRLEEKLGQGSFGMIYKCSIIENAQQNSGENVANSAAGQLAIKLEKRNQKQSSMIIREMKVMIELKTEFGFARMVASGRDEEYNYVVMTALGKNLDNVHKKCSNRFSLATCMNIADQILTRLEVLHSHNLIHRDIKPENFVVGAERNFNHVYLIDFGLAKYYKDHDGVHIAAVEKKGMIGTARYASVNAHLGMEQSRRDDLEAVGYVLLYFIRGKLPWQQIYAETKEEKYEKIKNMKMNFPLEQICEGCPIELVQYLKQVRKLEFTEQPNYSALKALFKKVLIDRRLEQQSLTVDWESLPEYRNRKKNMKIIQLPQIPTQKEIAQRQQFQRQLVLNQAAAAAAAAAAQQQQDKQQQQQQPQQSLQQQPQPQSQKTIPQLQQSQQQLISSKAVSQSNPIIPQPTQSNSTSNLNVSPIIAKQTSSPSSQQPQQNQNDSPSPTKQSAQNQANLSCLEPRQKVPQLSQDINFNQQNEKGSNQQGGNHQQQHLQSRQQSAPPSPETGKVMSSLLNVVSAPENPIIEQINSNNEVNLAVQQKSNLLSVPTREGLQPPSHNSSQASQGSLSQTSKINNYTWSESDSIVDEGGIFQQSNNNVIIDKNMNPITISEIRREIRTRSLIIRMSQLEIGDIDHDNQHQYHHNYGELGYYATGIHDHHMQLYDRQIYSLNNFHMVGQLTSLDPSFAMEYQQLSSPDKSQHRKNSGGGEQQQLQQSSQNSSHLQQQQHLNSSGGSGSKSQKKSEKGIRASSSSSNHDEIKEHVDDDVAHIKNVKSYKTQITPITEVKESSYRSAKTKTSRTGCTSFIGENITEVQSDIPRVIHTMPIKTAFRKK